MLTEERQARIISLLEETGSVTIQQLMLEFEASESTIRRDLNSLDRNGKLVKVYGGALRKSTMYNTMDDNVKTRMKQHAEAKIRIAQYAASLIHEDDFVYLDAGTTTEMMIHYITAKKAVFVTNAISHAKKLSEKGCKVYILGGEFKAVTEAIVGEEAVTTLEKYNFTKGFWGTNGISVNKGFSTPELKEAMVKKKSMENCKEKYVLCDESKFSKISSITFASFDSAIIITTGLQQPALKKYKNIVEV